MELDVWSPDTILGVVALDESHRILFDAMVKASTVSDAEFAKYYSALVADIERDFSEEEQIMEDIDYPGLKAHRELHARALSGLHHTESKVIGGDIGAGREALVLMPQWFEVHILTMDAALAAALQGAGSSQTATKFRT